MPDTVPVSVVIPCYNCGSTIGRAVSSVANQTAKPLEIIVINDASNDCSHAAILNLRRKYGDWIKYMDLKKNMGPAYARNMGLFSAKGDYISFLDADDSWHPRKTEIQYNWMKKHPHAALTSYRHMQVGDVAEETDIPDYIKIFRIKPWCLLLSNVLKTSSVMLRKNIPVHNDEDRWHSEDYSFWLKIVLSGYDAYFLDIPLVYYHKALYGESGLSSNLSFMEKKELETYRRLFREKYISAPCYYFVCFFSLIKYLRRLAVVRILGTGNARKGSSRTY